MVLQVFIAWGAPDKYGLARWASIQLLPEATGYFEVAKMQAGPDPWKFLADYPNWVQRQGAGHLGAHPPGLIAMFRGLIALMGRLAPAVDLLNAATPPAVERGFREIEARRGAPISKPDRAVVFLVSLMTLVACAATAAPLYLLARESSPPRIAWIAAGLWPLAPALNMFQPLSDSAYPLLSATALALAAWSVRLRGSAVSPALPAVVSGAVMGFGLLFSLAFLPIGLIVGLVVLTTRSTSWRDRVQVIGWIGGGCVAVVGLAWLATGADPLVTWMWNLRHNARFYVGGRRSYVKWLLINPIELAIAAGLPAVLWFLVALTADRRRVPRAAWCALVVLALADLAGGNRGEVARLWMIFLPPLFTAVGVGLDRLGGGRQAVFATIALTGIQTLGLQCLIQLVYPPN